MKTLVALALIVGAAAGCVSTIDVYRYAPRALPGGQSALATVSWSLGELESVNWGTHAHPAPGRARVGADRRGIAAAVLAPLGETAPPIYLSYEEIADHVRVVTHSENAGWMVRIATAVDLESDVEFVFRTERAARLFLDASTALAHRSDLAAL